MRVYGSIMNRIQEEMVMPEPQVGDGATQFCFSDRHALTIVAVHKNKAGEAIRVETTRDSAKRIDNLGMTDSGQRYEYTTNPDGHRTSWTKRKNGSWVRQGESLAGGSRIGIGHREEYYDFSF